MKALKIVAEGLTTSFRYPHFMLGIHPTFEMPPPATIYGHICSALGEWVDPEGVEFAYHFTHQGAFDDVEHIHVMAQSTGKLPGTKLPKVLEGTINPFKRRMLFRPRLVLYLNKPEWEQAFRSPYYPVVLGRSQDLFTYTNISVIDLRLERQAYFEHTLAPYQMMLSMGRGYIALMPRYLDYSNQRQPTFARYVILNRRVHSEEFIHYEGKPEGAEFWIDPTSDQVEMAHLGLWFHKFVGEYDGIPNMA
ncbi:MAG: CRISPR-associated protein Cas5 [Methanotrichaceae archaeon]